MKPKGEKDQYGFPVIPRQVVIEIGGEIREGGLIIEAIDEKRVRITAWEPAKG